MFGLLDWFREYLQNLEERERLVVILGIPVILLIVYFIVVIAPLKGLERECEKKLAGLRQKEEVIKEELISLEKLKAEVNPALARTERGKDVDLVSFFKKSARKAGLDLKNVKLLTGKVNQGIELVTVTATFSQKPLNSVALFIYKVENSGYQVKATTISISDQDGDGKVSGRVGFNFYRRAD